MRYCLYNPLNNVLKELIPSELEKLGYNAKRLSSLKNKKIKELNMYVVKPDIDTKTKKALMEKEEIEDELWKSINRLKGYEDIEGDKISNYGRIRNKYNKLIMPNLKKDGGKSLKVGLTDKNGKRVYINIGRLVGLAFVDNPKKYKTFRHIGDKYNNHYSNIEWLSNSDKMKDMSQKGRKITNNRPILKLDQYTLEILEEYKNSYDAERKEKYITATNIRHAIRNNTFAYDNRWCRKEDYIDILNKEYDAALSRVKALTK